MGSPRFDPAVAVAGAVGLVPAAVYTENKTAAERLLVEVGMVAACARVAEAAGRRRDRSVVGVGVAELTVAAGSVVGCRLRIGIAVESWIVAGLLAVVWG